MAGATQIGNTSFVYDDKARLTDLTHRDALDAILADYDYVRDLADQLTQETHLGQTSVYTHDDAGQLTSADHQSQTDGDYAYDANGNRTGGGYTVGPANRLLSDGIFNYAYDNEGNLVAKTEIVSGNVTEYTYDHRNRLVLVQEKSPGGIILSEVAFVYDALDRRIAKTVDLDGQGPQAAQTTRFVYDGQHVWTDFDGSGILTARYLFGDETDQILARWRPGEGPAWYLTDHLGTVRDVVGATGLLLNHFDYDSFGRLLGQTNAAAGDRFTYTGREFDAELGLYYYRARFYDPSTGRFTSQDPIGFAAGDANLYRYVGNSPLGATDPLGQMALTEYAVKLAKGAVGAIIASARWTCITMEVVGWGASKVIFNDYTFGENDAKSLVLGVISCTMCPTSAFAQGAFLITAEALYMAARGATAQEIAESALMHAIGIAGGQGLSKYGAKAWGRMGGFKITGQLKAIWDNPRLFKKWLKGTQSLSRVKNPLSHASV